MIDSAQDESTTVYINNNGYEILDFTLDDFYNSHIKESYKDTLDKIVDSFTFDTDSIVIELR
jgi:very-short-patch-repair endonuclease